MGVWSGRELVVKYRLGQRWEVVTAAEVTEKSTGSASVYFDE